MAPMAPVAVITMIAIMLYFWSLLNVIRARKRYKIAPPAITGDPNFERVLRTQINTGEHLMLFLPSLWICAYFLSPFWASILGGIWVVGRIVYAIGYYQNVPKRMPGFIIAMTTQVLLMIGALVGATLGL